MQRSVPTQCVARRMILCGTIALTRGICSLAHPLGVLKRGSHVLLFSCCSRQGTCFCPTRCGWNQRSHANALPAPLRWSHGCRELTHERIKHAQLTPRHPCFVAHCFLFLGRRSWCHHVFVFRRRARGARISFIPLVHVLWGCDLSGRRSARFRLPVLNKLPSSFSIKILYCPHASFGADSVRRSPDDPLVFFRRKLEALAEHCLTSSFHFYLGGGATAAATSLTFRNASNTHSLLLGTRVL